MEQITLKNGPLTFSALTDGFDRNPDGPIVICLHGFPDNARSFRFQLPALADAGFRAVAPTLRGYEPSSQPGNGDYEMATIGRDVIAWTDELGADKVHLVGHDWGAGISYVAAALAPERFLSVTTIAVPHGARFIPAIKQVPVQLLKSWYMNFFQLRGLADWLVERNDWAFIQWLWKNWSPGYVLPTEEWANLRATFSAPGVKKAMLAYYRTNVSPSVMFGFKQLEAAALTTVPVRTLAITGADDGCIDTRMYDHCFVDEDFPQGFRIERIEGAGHFAHQEKPQEINRLLLEWVAPG